MKKLLCISLIVATVAQSMEVPHGNDLLNVPSLFICLQNEISKPIHTNEISEQIHPKVILVADLLELITTLDLPFLSNRQAKNLKNELDGINQSIFEKRTDYTELFDYELDEYIYPQTFYANRLGNIKYIFESTHVLGYPDWPTELHLNRDGTERSFSMEEVEEGRTKMLEQMKQQALKNLEQAKELSFEKMPEFKNSAIKDLWKKFTAKIIDPNANPQRLKLLFACLETLMRIDCKELTSRQSSWLGEKLDLFAKLLWKSAINSKLYYRCYLTATEWAVKEIERNACQDLSWQRDILPEHLQKHPLKHVLAMHLQSQRLELLKEKAETIKELFENPAQRYAHKK
jgi:hypothetical protein